MLESIKEINEEILKIKKEGLSRDIATFKLNQELQLVLGSVKNDTHSLKNGQGKVNLVILGIVFITGITLGTQFKVWSPFVNEIYNTFKIIKG